jgi:hypothetical protein
MRTKSLMVGTAVAVGLLTFDIATLSVTTTAQAEQKKTVRSSTTTRNLSVSGAGAKFRTRTTTTTTTNTFINKNVSKTIVNKNTTTVVNRGNPVLLNQGLKLNKGPGVVRVGVVNPGPGVKFVALGGRNWPIIVGPRRVWWGGGWRTFLPFTALGVVIIGGGYYWANSYVAVGRPYCAGTTPDGCYLNWQFVGFEGGDGDYQCVQFCPRPGEPPPAQAVALVAPPEAPKGACKLTIFAEPNFAGPNSPASDDQPRLAEVGWKDQISSIKVENGSWDFFTGDDFSGESMRLAPGSYPQLQPDWNKHIGSFMCVQGT